LDFLKAIKELIMTPKAVQRDILSFSLVYLVPVSVVAGSLLGGGFTFLTPVFVFGVVPVLDILIGWDVRNPNDTEAGELERRREYRWLTWCCAPLQAAVVFCGAYVVSRGILSPLETAGFTVSVGISSGILGINVAHELVHRVNEKFEPVLGKIMLWTVLYGHWGDEHITGHHRWVATPVDPATARLGESYYGFWPRTVTGGFKSAWRFSLEKMGKKGRPVWHPVNPVMITLAAEAVLLVVIGLLFGVAGLLFFAVQSVIAFSLLEIVNYIEHYGLVRKETGPGQYEPVRPYHSWNSSNWLTNRFLFNLQRHSDHHYKPARRYQVLRHHDVSPQLPTGYAGMILLAVVPPLWRIIMDPHAAASRPIE